MKKFIASLLAVFVFVWLFWVYFVEYHQGFVKSVFYSLSIFFGNLKEFDEFSSIDYAIATLGLLLVIWAVVALYIKLFGSSLKKFWKLNFANPILVIGLGEGNSAYIESELKSGNKNIVAIESDSSNKYLATFKDSIVCIVGDAKEIIKTINVGRLKHIVISVGDDLENMAIAKEILSANKNIEVYLHLNSRDLKNANLLKSVLKSDNIHIFSYYQLSARELFAKQRVVRHKTITSNREFKIAISGDVEFVLEVFYQAVMMGQLPNGNRFEIFLLGNNTKELKDAIELNFNIADIPNLKVEYIEADSKQKEFYDLELWKSEDLEHIVLCYNSDKQNIEIATQLNQKCFIKEISNHKDIGAKIDIALSSSSALADSLSDDKDKFGLINIFGKTKEVSSKDSIIANKRDKIAMGVDFVYSNVGVKLVDYDSYKYSFYLYNGGKEIKPDEYIEIENSKWNELIYFHKESNRAVADHILVKLQYLGLGLKPSNINDKERLFKQNAKLFFEAYNDKKRAVLAQCEHNRWMAFYYLQGFKKVDFLPKADKSSNTEIATKEHMCLVPFKEFKQRSKELESLGYSKGYFEGFDIMIVEFIPNIVSSARFEIVKG